MVRRDIIDTGNRIDGRDAQLADALEALQARLDRLGETGALEVRTIRVRDAGEDGTALLTALSEEVARGRAQQAVVVARGDDGAIVAVSTAAEGFSRQLGRRFWFTRVFVGEPARRQHLAMETFAAARDTLEARFVQGEDPDCIGIVVEVESPVLKAHRNQAVWQTGPVFFGRNARGDHLRVYYFPGATIA